METNNREANMPLGEKIKTARRNAGMTQEQLAVKLMVSRQAITKWESGKGMPDIENLKQLSKLLNVTIDYLLDDEESIDLSVIREQINLNDYIYNRKISGRWVKKAGKKDMAVMEKYPDAEIHCLVGEQKLTKGEKATDTMVGILTSIISNYPLLGIPEFIESRQLAEKITEKKFEIGEFSFVDCGVIKAHFV